MLKLLELKRHAKGNSPGRGKMRRQRGFTYIEILIAITILTIAVPPVLIALAGVVKSSASSEFMQVSDMLAEEQLDRIHSLSFSAVADEGPTSFSSPFASYTYEITVSAVPAALNNNCADTSECKQVDIEIVDPAGGALTVVTMVTAH